MTVQEKSLCILFAGYLSGKIPELGKVEPSKILDAVNQFFVDIERGEAHHNATRP